MVAGSSPVPPTTRITKMINGRSLYEKFWERQKPVNTDVWDYTPWDTQSEVIRKMWDGIANDANSLGE